MHESKVHMFPLKEAPNGNLYYKNTTKNINKDYRISFWLTQVAFNSKFNSNSLLLVLSSFNKSVIMTTGRAHPDVYFEGTPVLIGSISFVTVQ